MCLLQPVDGGIEHLPLTLPCSHQHQQQIRACREVPCLVANDKSTELLLSLFNGIVQHLNDTFIDGVHLGMELDTAYTIAKINEHCRAVVTDHFVICLNCCQRDGSLWHGDGLVGVCAE